MLRVPQKEARLLLLCQDCVGSVKNVLATWFSDKKQKSKHYLKQLWQLRLIRLFDKMRMWWTQFIWLIASNIFCGEINRVNRYSQGFICTGSLGRTWFDFGRTPWLETNLRSLLGFYNKLLQNINRLLREQTLDKTILMLWALLWGTTDMLSK